MADTNSIVLSEDDVDDLNKALSLACIGADVVCHGDGDKGVHLSALCDTIATHLCNIRNRHTAGERHRATILLGGDA